LINQWSRLFLTIFMSTSNFVYTVLFVGDLLVCVSINNYYCEPITIGTKRIGELLNNCSLEKIYMEGNNIGDDGITAIARTLGKSRIRVLDVARCGITIMGAKELTTALSTNQTIITLNLYDNPITVEGAHLMLQSAIDNGVCEEVITSDDYRSDNEVHKMMTILQTRSEANKR